MLDRKERLSLAIADANKGGADKERDKIGKLGEKTLHAVLKNYFQPDKSKQEVKIGAFYADIADNGKIIEIQTGNFNALRKKLDYLLISYSVTVVYPIAEHKTVCWVDPKDGSVSSRRKSPRKGSIYDSLSQLYFIRDYLGDENLTVCLLLADIDEYKLLDGYGESRKRKASKFERIPTAVNDEIFLRDMRDYMMLLPPGLPDEFSVAELSKAIRLSVRYTYSVVKLFVTTGCVESIGKVGRKNMYRIINR